MAPKRKLQDSNVQDEVHASRQSQVYGTKPRPAKKPRVADTAKKQVHASSVNAIKKKIRDVSRRLDLENLPANVRVQDERALATYEQELAEAEAEKTRQKMIKKYHMVRFFERQKATRLLKKLRKLLVEADSTEAVESLKTRMHIAEVDLNYTRFFPLSETYVSLYPSKKADAKDEDDKPEEKKAKPQMWKEVEKCMVDGTLQQLQSRPPNTPANTSKRLDRKPPKPKPAEAIDTTGMNRRERRSLRGVTKEGRPKNKSAGFEKNKAFGATLSAGLNEADDDDSSQGGFFEE